MMWKCPDCGETEPLEFQMGHLRHCKVVLQRKAEKEIERLVSQLPNTHQDMPLHIDAWSCEWYYDDTTGQMAWEEIPF